MTYLFLYFGISYTQQLTTWDYMSLNLLLLKGSMSFTTIYLGLKTRSILFCKIFLSRIEPLLTFAAFYFNIELIYLSSI